LLLPPFIIHKIQKIQTQTDMIYGDREYSWDAYIQAERLIKKGVPWRSV
jgi:hypothetical protein